MTDLSKKTTGATCLRDKMDLLDYCKKVSESPRLPLPELSICQVGNPLPKASKVGVVSPPFIMCC